MISPMTQATETQAGWQQFKARYITPEGRVIDSANQNISHSEGQGYGMLMAVVEKPNPEQAPSNLSVVGRYVFSAEIWPLLDGLPAGVGGEIQLTDAIDLLLKKEVAEAYTLVGKSHDCGNKLGYMKAFVEYGLHNSELKEEFALWIQELYAKDVLSQTMANNRPTLKEVDNSVMTIF
nr:glycosyl hydrolase family 8 [Proteus mirabilis]